MKKYVLAAMSVAMFGSVSYANADYSAEAVDNSVVYEQEDGAMSQDAVDMVSEDGMTIFGAVDAWSFPTRPGRPGGPGYGRPGPGRPGDGRPGRPGRPEPRFVTCFARNARGEMFRATDRDARWAQRSAMNKCERVSRICRPAGCR